MGEKANAPEKPNKLEENPEDEMEVENEEEEDIDEITTQEFQVINNQLNALNSALDDIEQKNSNIQAELLQLLQSNREIRKQIQEEKHADSETP